MLTGTGPQVLPDSSARLQLWQKLCSTNHKYANYITYLPAADGVYKSTPAHHRKV